MTVKRKFLLWDERVIDRAEGAELVPGSAKQHGRILMEQDRLWEVRTDNMDPNILYDREAQCYKLWYTPFVRFQRHPWGRECALAYAVSPDGLRWEKPILNLCPFNGSTANNLLARAVHGGGVRKDLHEHDPARRYKLIYLHEPNVFSEVERGRPIPPTKAVRTAFSPDGLRWHWPEDAVVLVGDKVGDTHNNWFWDARTGRYIGFTRMWDPTRVVARVESEDFIHWGEPEIVVRAEPDEVHTYQPYAMPVFPYEDLYLGMVAMFKAPPGEDTVDVELAISTDTKSWRRPFPHHPLIPRGERGSFDSHVIFGPLSPIVTEREILVYYAGCNGRHTGIRETGLGLATFRLDGFAAWQGQGEGEAILVTKVLECSGRRITVNADVEKGRLRVGILTAAGNPRAGFEADNCREITVDSIDQAVTWQGQQDLGSLVGQPIRMEFRLAAGRLYSFSFHD